MTTSGFLSAKEAANRYGLSESWLAKLRIYGGGPDYMKVGKRILYKISSFDEWLESQKVSS